MPAPSPYTPPQPVEPPQQQTPRLSFAQRLDTPSRRLSTPTPESDPSYFNTPVSLRRKRFSSATTVRRQLIPCASTSSSESWSAESQPSTSWAGERPATPEQGDPRLDEDLRDPEFFIKLFSRIDGPLLHSDIELREKLERYLLKVNLNQEDTTSMPGTSKDKRAGPSNVNFAEAALVVQGSTRIYGKKVDLLFNAAVQLFRLLSTPFEEQEEEGEDEAGPTDTPKSRKNSKKLRLGIENRDLAEDIALVDGMKEGGRIEQKKSSRVRFSELIKNLASMPPRGSVRFLPPNIPRLVRKTKTLGTNDKEVEKINSRRVPQYGQGMEARGFIDEYRLNEVLRRPDCMLVEHFVPFELESIKSSPAGEGHTPTGKAQHPSHCDSGIDSCPSSVYNPVECSDSVIWEGSSVGVYGEADVLSCGDDGFISEGVHEECISELEEESELDVNKESELDVNKESELDVNKESELDVSKESELDVSKESASKTADMESSQTDTVEIDLGMIETERSGTESSGVFSEHGPVDEPPTSSLPEDERIHDIGTIDEPHSTSATEDEAVPEPHPEHSSVDELDTKNLINDSRVTENPEPVESTNREHDSIRSSKTPTSSKSELKEVEFTPTPRRNKRKLKNFKLPCKVSLLMPEKKKRMGRGSRAAELWRPRQSPCSSVSSHYPQSPISFAPLSPDPHSLSQLMLQDDDHNEDLDNLSESDNEGEYFDSPSDGQPQVNYWIQNHQKDLMSDGEPTTLSDQVAQWQELIMPRLEANLNYGPYSHVRYAPVLIELIARNGWPPPESNFPCTNDDTEVCVEASDSEDMFVLDQAPHSQSVRSSSPSDTLFSYQIPYDADFMDPEGADAKVKGDRFFGFQTPKRLKRRGFALVEGSLNKEVSGGHLFTSLSKEYNWGLRETEEETLASERRMREWASEKKEWLQSKVRASRLQRNWDEWAEENDNIETNTELDVHLPSPSVSSCQNTEPVLFTTVFSGFRKEEVSRLLFTALHLASQGVMEITSESGEINSMKLSLLADQR